MPGTFAVDTSVNEHSVIQLARLWQEMADDKQSRGKQADDEERRQRERELEEARDRSEEAEPIHDEPGERLGDLDEALEQHDYPTTTEALIKAHGNREVETRGGRGSVEEVLGPVDNETYDSPDDVQSRIQGLIHR